MVKWIVVVQNSGQLTRHIHLSDKIGQGDQDKVDIFKNLRPMKIVRVIWGNPPLWKQISNIGALVTSNKGIVRPNILLPFGGKKKIKDHKLQWHLKQQIRSSQPLKGDIPNQSIELSSTMLIIGSLGAHNHPMIFIYLPKEKMSRWGIKPKCHYQRKTTLQNVF